MKLFFGLLTFDSEPILERFWNSFYNSVINEPHEMDLYWADNDSHDNTRHLMSGYYAYPINVVVERFYDRNTGIVIPRNNMLRFAMQYPYDWYFLINDDLVFQKGWLEKALQTAAKHPKNGLITCYDNVGHLGTKEGTISQCGGVFWMLRPDMVKEIGIIHPKFTWLSQDSEYCSRVYDWGWRAVVIQDKDCIQHKHYTKGKRTTDDLSDAARIDHWRHALMLQHVNWWHLWMLRKDFIGQPTSQWDKRLFEKGDINLEDIDIIR